MWIAIIAVVAALAMLAAFLLSGNRRANVRQKELGELGVLLFGVEMEEYAPLKLMEGTGLPFFAEGRNGVAKNFFRFKEEDGLEACFFDYGCATGAPGSEVKRECTVALFDCKKAVFPNFFVSPDGSGAQPSIPGYAPADVKNFPGLPGNAKVYADDSKQLAVMLNAGKTELFAKEPDWNAQGSGQYLLIYKDQLVVSPGGYQEFVKAAKLFALRLAA
jgi:hypothetical protein